MTFKSLQITTWKSGTKEITALLNGGPVVYIKFNNKGLAYDSTFKSDSNYFKKLESVARPLI